MLKLVESGEDFQATILGRYDIETYSKSRYFYGK